MAELDFPTQVRELKAKLTTAKQKMAETRQLMADHPLKMGDLNTEIYEKHTRWSESILDLWDEINSHRAALRRLE